jgi:hypothetical protein
MTSVNSDLIQRAAKAQTYLDAIVRACQSTALPATIRTEFEAILLTDQGNPPGDGLARLLDALPVYEPEASVYGGDATARMVEGLDGEWLKRSDVESFVASITPASSASDHLAFHSALTRCAELLDNMSESDSILETARFLTKKLADLDAAQTALQKDWKQYHAALSQCAELLNNMVDGDSILETPKYLARKLASNPGAVDVKALNIPEFWKLARKYSTAPAGEARDSAENSLLAFIANTLGVGIEIEHSPALSDTRSPSKRRSPFDSETFHGMLLSYARAVTSSYGDPEAEYQKILSYLSDPSLTTEVARIDALVASLTAIGWDHLMQVTSTKAREMIRERAAARRD